MKAFRAAHQVSTRTSCDVGWESGIEVEYCLWICWVIATVFLQWIEHGFKKTQMLISYWFWIKSIPMQYFLSLLLLTRIPLHLNKHSKAVELVCELLQQLLVWNSMTSSMARLDRSMTVSMTCSETDKKSSNYRSISAILSVNSIYLLIHPISPFRPNSTNFRELVNTHQ